MHAGAPENLAQIVICTSDGTKLVSIAIDKEMPDPPGQDHSCPCGILCSACNIPLTFTPTDACLNPYNFAGQTLPGLENDGGTTFKDWKASPRAPPRFPV
ncbi:MAG: hypothetical protein ACR2OR_15185 [Hyphomicrobiales bacterium]